MTDKLLGILEDITISMSKKVSLIAAIEKHGALSDQQLDEYMSREVKYRAGDVGRIIKFGSTEFWLRHVSLKNVGDEIGHHSHDFTHDSYLSNGSLRVMIEGEGSKDYSAPAFLVIEKGKVHNLIALEANTVTSCIAEITDAFPESERKSARY